MTRWGPVQLEIIKIAFTTMANSDCVNIKDPAISAAKLQTCSEGVWPNTTLH